jgi:hypothetical protein
MNKKVIKGFDEKGNPIELEMDLELTLDNYYSTDANMEYMSASQFKDFEKCELYGLMKAKGEYLEEKTKPMLMGGYIDAYFSNRLEEYKQENPQIFKKDGTLLKDFEKVEECIRVAENDELFMSRTKGEKQAILVGVIGGVKYKGAIDFLNDDGIDDLKLVASIYEPVWVERDGRNIRTNFIDAYEYDLQGAIYKELVAINRNKDLPFNINALSKEEEPDKAIINIPNDILANKLEKVVEKSMRFDLIKKGIIEPRGCGVCPICRKYKKLDKVLNYKEVFKVGDNDEPR